MIFSYDATATEKRTGTFSVAAPRRASEADGLSLSREVAGRSAPRAARHSGADGAGPARAGARPTRVRHGGYCRLLADLRRRYRIGGAAPDHPVGCRHGAWRHRLGERRDRGIACPWGDCRNVRLERGGWTAGRLWQCGCGHGLTRGVELSRAWLDGPGPYPFPRFRISRAVRRRRALGGDLGIGDQRDRPVRTGSGAYGPMLRSSSHVPGKGAVRP